MSSAPARPMCLLWNWDCEGRELPTYDLTCQDCGERFELFVMRLLREEDRICRSCGGADVKAGVGGGFLRVAVSTGASGETCGTGGFT